MDLLLKYINGLPPSERDEFATLCKTSIGYLRKAVSTKQLLGATLCVAIEQASGGVVTRKHLRPNDWPAVWPELITLGSKAA